MLTDGRRPAVETVYVVDDDASMRKALERLLRTEGFSVEAFESAVALLARDRDAAPSCAVVDVRMLPFDGLELQRRLKDEGRLLPLVFVTGHGDVPTSVRAMKSGAIDFIEKPFSNEDLVAAVRAALEASRRGTSTRDWHAALRRRVASLTPREREVFLLVAQGLPNKVIGIRLGASEKTIKVHRGRVMEKMAAGSLAELVRMAERLGSTEP